MKKPGCYPCRVGDRTVYRSSRGRLTKRPGPKKKREAGISLIMRRVEEHSGEYPIWPTVDEMAAWTGACRRTIYNWLRHSLSDLLSAQHKRCDALRRNPFHVPSPKLNKLTNRQRMFVTSVLIEDVQYRTYQSIYRCSARSAQYSSWRLMRRRDIQEALQEFKESANDPRTRLAYLYAKGLI